MTDVLAGLAMGAVVERCLRPLSKGAIRPDIEARAHARVERSTLPSLSQLHQRRRGVFTSIIAAPPFSGTLGRGVGQQTMGPPPACWIAALVNGTEQPISD